MKQFLGFTDFFRKFTQGYANAAAPLSDLTKKNVPFVWTPSCQRAFEQLKHALISAPVLATPDPEAPFKSITDSCGYGTGAVLMQSNRPVAVYSGKVTAPERNFVNREQALLAAIVALKVYC